MQPISAQDTPSPSRPTTSDTLSKELPDVDASEQIHSCTQNLIDAEDSYSKGQIEKVSELISTCLKNGFSPEEKNRALRLLTLCHLYYNQDTAAANSMLHMLKNFPEYKISKELDPAEFVALYNTFKTRPMFIIGIKAGSAISNIYQINNYNDLNSEMSSGSYRTGATYFAGLCVETPIYKKLSVSYEIYYKNSQYSFQNKPVSYSNVEMNETDISLDLPIMIQYNFLNKNIIPYINAGTSLTLLLNSKANFTRTDKELDQVRTPFTYSPDITSQRNKLNYALTAGAGVRIKNLLSNGYITFDIRYSRYMCNQIDPDKRASDPKITYDYLYTDNALKFENFSFFVGYKIPIYIPRQKRSAKLKPSHSLPIL